MTPGEFEQFQGILDKEYDEVFRAGRAVLLTHGVQAPRTNAERDTRRSLDTNYHLPESLRQAVDTKVLGPFRALLDELDTTQGVFDASWLHMTLYMFYAAEKERFIVKSPEDRYEPTPEDLREIRPYQDIFNAATETSGPVPITFNRLFASPSSMGCLVLGGTPHSPEVVDTRARFKALVTERGVEVSQRRESIFH